MPKKLPVSIGQTFNHLTLVAAPKYGAGTFRCSCGTERTLQVRDVFRGKVKSCGCQTASMRKASLMEKYGVENASQSEVVKAKRSATFIRNLGVASPFLSPTVVAKKEATMLKKYGFTSALAHPDVQAKRKATTMLHYGVENPMHSSDIVSKALQDKIDDGLIRVLPNGETITEACERASIKHPTYAQALFARFGGEVTLEWINTYTKKISSLEIFVQSKFPDLVRYEVVPEELKAIGAQYRPDFKASETVYFDADGLLYHSDKVKTERAFHMRKREAYEKAGLRLLQFYQDEIVNKTAIVASIVAHNSKGSAVNVGARTLSIQELSRSEAATFFSDNHLMGHHGTSRAIGLVSATGEILAGLSYKKSPNSNGIEISRYCPKLNTNVMGGLSRLMLHAAKQDRADTITSFIDLRYGTGKSLEKLGFTKEKEHLSFRWTDGYTTFPRQACMATPTMTEKEHAETKGWNRIYDAGQAKYVLTLK